MILTVCYNSSCENFPKEVETFCAENFPYTIVISYSEDLFNEKKKAYKVKGGYSARMTPFMLLTTDEKAYVKAFYSEDNGCTINALKTFLSNVNTSN